MSEKKSLLTDETIEAYKNRLINMNKHKFSEKGDELFIETISAVSEQINNLHVRTHIEGCDFEIDSDEPSQLGGSNLAPRPMEILVASLTNCLEISALLYSTFLKININSIKVKVEATFDKRSVLPLKEAPLPGFYAFKTTWFIETEEELKNVEKVINRVEKYCPVMGTMTRSPNFSHKIELISTI